MTKVDWDARWGALLLLGHTGVNTHYNPDVVACIKRRVREGTVPGIQYTSSEVHEKLCELGIAHSRADYLKLIDAAKRWMETHNER